MIKKSVRLSLLAMATVATLNAGGVTAEFGAGSEDLGDSYNGTSTPFLFAASYNFLNHDSKYILEGRAEFTSSDAFTRMGFGADAGYRFGNISTKAFAHYTTLDIDADGFDTGIGLEYKFYTKNNGIRRSLFSSGKEMSYTDFSIGVKYTYGSYSFTEGANADIDYSSVIAYISVCKWSK